MHTVTYTAPAEPRPSTLLRFAQEAAEDHCKKLGADWDTMMAKGCFWAVIRQRLEITRLPEAGETVTVKTWPLPTTRAAYPRAAQGFDQQGNSLFRVISLWVIMDVQTRAMVLPGKSGVTVEGCTYGNELKAPGSLPPVEGTRESLRTVSPRDLDQNGHMNNTRYLDWLLELPEGEKPLKAVTLCYLSEALEGQTLRLRWTPGEVFLCDGLLEGTNASSGRTRIFSARAES